MHIIEVSVSYVFFFFQAEDGIRDLTVTGVQTCALPICKPEAGLSRGFALQGRRWNRFPVGVWSETRVTGQFGNQLCRMSLPSSGFPRRSEEHTSELQSQSNLVCRLLLEKKTNDAGLRTTVKSRVLISGVTCTSRNHGIGARPCTGSSSVEVSFCVLICLFPTSVVLLTRH